MLQTVKSHYVYKWTLSHIRPVSVREKKGRQNVSFTLFSIENKYATFNEIYVGSPAFEVKYHMKIDIAMSAPFRIF